MKIATFTANQMGRDFICSDIHGYYGLLEKKLEAVGFEPQKDRLFALGDLIDHGEQSHLAADYLAKSWFHSVLGNHELILLNACDSKMADAAMLAEWNLWGGRWASGLTLKALSPYYQAMVNLPMAIELELRNDQKVALLHAQLPEICDWSVVKSALLTKALDDNSTTSPLTKSLLHNRGQATGSAVIQARMQLVANIDHVFQGHTIVDEMVTVANRTFMDLGSYKTGNIGLIEPLAFLARYEEKAQEKAQEKAKERVFCV
jgi:serine/threonine protein phosphatase 1